MDLNYIPDIYKEKYLLTLEAKYDYYFDYNHMFQIINSHDITKDIYEIEFTNKHVGIKILASCNNY